MCIPSWVAEWDDWYRHVHIPCRGIIQFRGRQFVVHLFRCTDHCKFWNCIRDRGRGRKIGHVTLPIGVSFGADVCVDVSRGLHDCS